MTANFVNAQRNVEREQLIAEIRTYMAEVDSLLNCRGRDCDARIGVIHASLAGRSRRILGMHFSRRLYESSGSGQSFTLYSNCPEYTTNWRDCEKREFIYSQSILFERHRITGKQSSRETRTYSKNNRKVARIERITSNGISETTTTFYNNRGRVIYQSSTREKQ